MFTYVDIFILSIEPAMDVTVDIWQPDGGSGKNIQ